ncbi:hypothetical protein PT974_10103 [Cladobotryum mycophilum]|uniref:Uncharacterized protein n=1 Tax=Cladobotryum mycophilum TaxID=491253 RepID=A0ABR0S8X3_9HYPO
MLRRNSSKNTQSRRPLGRSKSTNSIARNPVHELVSIEPITAQRDAYIAANLSYHRAQAKGKGGQEVVMMPRDLSRAALARRNSFASGPDLISCSSPVHRNDSVAASPKIHRQQSVRFAGPNAKPRRALAARASMNSVAPKTTSLVLHGTAYAENQPPGTGPLINKKLRKHASVQNYRHTPRTDNSTYTLEDEVISMPPSYRKLRKSRSMYTSSFSQTPSHFSNGGSVDRFKEWLTTPGHTLTKENKSLAPELRAPKSMSFIRGHHGRSHARTSSSYAEKDLAAHLAREELRAQSEHSNRLKSQPSLFFRSKHRRHQSSIGFPRTLRNSSENSAAISSAFSGETLSISKQVGLRTTARKVSKSLKSRIKGLFGRPKSADDAADYAQDQQCDNHSDVDSCFRVNESATLTQEASMSRVPSHLPSFHAVPSNQQLKSRQGSFESIRGEDQAVAEDKSRVTSWTNSTTNTATSYGVQGNWESQHLAAIREIGVHVPPITLTHAPNQRTKASSEATVTIRGPLVDSQRVYSALLKRMEEARQQGKQSMQLASLENRRIHHLESLDSSPTKNQSQRTLREGSSHTIRCVQDDDDVFRDNRRESISSCKSTGSTESVIRHRPISQGVSTYKAFPNPTAGDGLGLSPGKRGATSGVNLELPNALPTRNSAFFGSPTCHLFRTASPYRRALRENIKAAQEHNQAPVPNTKYLGSLSALSLPTRRPSPDGSEKDIQETYAESVYSCTSDGKKATDHRQCDTFAARNFTELSGNSEHGAATIFVNAPVYRPHLPSNHKRDISSASSVEWKTWLSANVSKLETPSTTLKTDFPEDSTDVRRPFGHVREEAEIEPEGDAVKGEDNKSVTSHAALPLKLVDIPASVQTASTPGSQQPAERWRRRSHVSNENTPPTLDRSKELFPKETPLMPSRSNLCNVPTATNVNATASMESCSRNATELPRMRSFNTLGKPSPTREEILHKRRSRTRLRKGDAPSAKSSPGLTAAVERQFGITKTGSPGWAWPGQSGTPDTPQTEAGSNMDGKGLGTRHEVDPQVMGSKKMVDLFLSSRRKRIGSGTRRRSSDSFAPAFI